ncbi:MAG TPA: hypothetical protein DCL54_09225 [Alphaproteobacteria bacterium]|nr:hypothetical protein [Alphaproteobacteria bacterium]
MSLLSNRGVQIGGGVGAVALAGLLGYFTLGGETKEARVARLCGTAPVELTDAGLKDKVKIAADVIASAVTKADVVAEVETASADLFRQISTTEERSAAEPALRHAACVAVAGHFVGKEADDKVTLAKSAVLKGAKAIEEQRQAALDSCISGKVAEAEAKKSLVQKFEVLADGAGADGKQVVSGPKRECLVAEAGFEFVGTPSVKQLSCSDGQCVLPEVQMSDNAEGLKQACVDIEARSEAKANGAGGWNSVELSAEVHKAVTDDMKAQFKTECEAPTPTLQPTSETAPTEPTMVDPSATPVPAAPEAAPAAPEAAPAAPATP